MKSNEMQMIEVSESKMPDVVIDPNKNPWCKISNYFKHLNITDNTTSHFGLTRSKSWNPMNTTTLGAKYSVFFTLSVSSDIV